MAWHHFGLLSAYFNFFFFYASLAGLNVRLTDPSPFLGDDEYIDEQHHHHHAAPGAPSQNTEDDVRQSHVFP